MDAINDRAPLDASAPIEARTLRKILRDASPELYRVARDVYWAARASRIRHMLDRRFRTLSPGAPRAIADALAVGGVSGDYYEFGLWRGYTFWHAQQTADERTRRFWGFDSFEGLPALDGPDRDGGIFYEGEFACALQKVRRNLDRHGGIDWTRTGLIPGFFEEILTDELRARHDFGPVRVAFVDCDLWSATRCVLDWLAPIVQAGTIILFDDWGCFGGREDLGQALALSQWLDTNPQWQAVPLYGFSNNGQGFTLMEASCSRPTTNTSSG